MESLVSQVVAALTTIYAPSSTNDMRKSANEYCDSLKEHSEAPLLGHHLCHQNQAYPDEIRHFGLSLIENAIRFKWNDGSYSDKDRGQIRDLVLDLVKNGVRPHDLEKSFIKEKLVRSFVEIVKRMWPLSWVELNTTLRTMYTQNHTTREYSILILRSLCEDVFLYEDTVAEVRKRELVTGMQVIMCSFRILGVPHSATTTTTLATAQIDVLPTIEAFIATAGLSDTNRYDNQVFQSVLKANSADCEGWLCKWSGDLEVLMESLNQNMGSGNSSGALTDENTIISILKVMAVTMYWIPLSAVVDSSASLRLLDLMLCPSKSIRLYAAEALLVLYSRAASGQQSCYRYDAVLHPFFEPYSSPFGGVMTGFDKIRHAWARCHNNQPFSQVQASEQEYFVIKRIAQLYAAIGENFVCHKTITSPPPNLASFLQEMILIAEHPSPMVSAMPLTALVCVLKQEQLKVSQIVLDLMPSMLDLSLRRLSKKSIEDPVCSYYASIDYDSDSEQNGAISFTRNKMMEIVKQIAALKPLDTYKWMYVQIKSLLTTAPSDDEMICLDSHGHVTQDTPFYARFEAHALIMGLVLEAPEFLDILKQKSETGSEILISIEQLLTFSVAMESADPFLIRLKLDLLSAFTPIIEFDPRMMLPCLSKLFDYVRFLQKDEENIRTDFPGLWHTKLSLETRIVRMKSSHALAKLASAMPDILLKVYTDLNSLFRSLVQDQLITHTEQNVLHEMIVTIIFFAESLPLDQKKALFHESISPLIANWSSGISTPMFDLAVPVDVVGKMAFDFLGLNVIAENEKSLRMSSVDLSKSDPVLFQSLGDVKARRYNLLKSLTSLNHLLNRTLVKKPTPKHDLWGPYIPQIIPNVLALIRSIHSLWAPSLWTGFTPDILAVTNISTAEKRVLLKSNTIQADPTMDEKGPSDSNFAMQIDMLKYCLSTLREHSYSIVGHLSSVGARFYSIPNIHSSLQQCLFAFAENIGNKHWTSLIQTCIRPLTMNCPPEAFPFVLGTTLPPFLYFIRDKLNTEWKVLVANGLKLNNPEEDAQDESQMEDDVSDEILAELILRSLTNACAKLMVSIFETEGNEQTKVSFKRKELAPFILQSESLAKPTLFGLLALISYMDSKAAKVAVQICIRLVKHVLPETISDAPSYYDHYCMLFGNEMLTSALQCVHDPYHQEVHSDAISLITIIYVRLLLFSEHGLSHGLHNLREVLASLPGKARVEDLVELEAKMKSSFGNKLALKEQTALIRTFLNGIKGISISQWGAKKSSFLLNASEKEILKRKAKDTNRADILDSEDSNITLLHNQ